MSGVMDWKKEPIYFRTTFNSSWIPRCEECDEYNLASSAHLCIVCGKQLCNKCYHAGFCKKHFFALEKSDRIRVEHLARLGQLSWPFFIGGIIMTLIVIILIAKLFPVDFFPWTLSIIVFGGMTASLLVPTIYDQVLRASFWRVVGKYDFKAKEDDEVEVSEIESAEEKESQDEIEGDQVGDAEMVNHATDPLVKVCGKCGWMLMTTDGKCPRCGQIS